MAKIRNTKYAGKRLIIGSISCEFDKDGDCECTHEVAKSIKGMKNFHVIELGSPETETETKVPVVEVSVEEVLGDEPIGDEPTMDETPVATVRKIRKPRRAKESK